MKPHAQIWFAQDGTFYLPMQSAASMRMGLDSINKGWFPTSITLCSLGELAFRYEQDVRYMDRIRIMPAVLTVSLHEQPFGIAFDYEWIAVKRLQWHGHINWRAVMSTLLEHLRSEYPLKVCGYDGPETAC